jgi:Na+-transporting methylmalonyl-CoA/oxaloacetate decarboxylase gamma subunit
MREQVLSGSAFLGGAAGLGILMTQGMGTWMHRCREFAPIVADAGRHNRFAAPIPAKLETQVAAIIAAMVLNRSRRELQ